MKHAVLDMAMAAGALLMAYGVWRAWAPGGFIVGGFLLSAGAFLVGNGARPAK